MRFLADGCVVKKEHLPWGEEWG